jgi:hypothetical protein
MVVHNQNTQIALSLSAALSGKGARFTKLDYTVSPDFAIRSTPYSATPFETYYRLN